MISGWSILFIWPLIMALINGNPLLGSSNSIIPLQNFDQNPNKGNIFENFSIENIFNIEEIYSINKSYNMKREFSFTGLVETVFVTMTNVFNSIVGNDLKNSKSINKVSYKDYKLLRIISPTKSQVNNLYSLRETEPDGIKFWTSPVENRSTDILVSPNSIEDVQQFLKEHNMKFSVLISDLQKTISNQNPIMSKEKRLDLVSTQGHAITWKRYHRYGEIMRYLEHLATRYPTLVELVTIGNSFEGQPLKVVKVSSGSGKDGNPKPTIWIDAGMHAREWISSAVATFILNQLVEKNSTYTKLLEISDWMILPVANPDGYEFTHTTDRLWRKTRSSQDSSENEARYTPTGLFHLVAHITRWFFSDCEGVDLNRNFGYHWGDAKVEGTSSDPCKETYAGPKAFSEPESRAISDYIMKNKKNIRAYLTLHSYSQMFLMPWGFTHSKPSDYDDLLNVAKKATNAIAKIHGTNYKVGPSSELLYLTTGSSDDWAKGVAGIKYAYTVELRDRGTYGFLLPASQIVPTARETWAGIRAIARLVTSKN